MTVALAQRSFAVGERVAVLLPLPLAGAYDYQVPEACEVAAGDFVEVPLGGRHVIGVVWGAAAGTVDDSRLKPIRRRIDSPPLPEVSRRFVDWVASYTLSSPGAVLRMAMSVPSAFTPSRPTIGYRPTAGAPDAPDLRMTPARARVLTLAREGPPRPIVELAREAGVGPAVVRGLIAAGALHATPLAEPPPLPDWRRPGVSLSPEQKAAADVLRGAAGDGFGVVFLDGIAGAGKTEVYFEAIAAALARGRQVLVLLPEIALSAQWLQRFAARFGAAPLVWHSEIGSGQRRRTWRAVADGTAKVVVGARSALFLPFADLNLIVVDEEHDASFKQEDGVLYHARDMAVVRARLGGIGCILVSATPSLETVLNVRNQRYRAVALPPRADSPGRPEIAVIDLRRHPPPKTPPKTPPQPPPGTSASTSPGAGFIAEPLRLELAETFKSGGQALLFLNRRGYAPLTLCRACGHRLHCPSCTAWLVEHRLIGRLQCHHCGHQAPVPTACPACGAAHSLAACGPGVERLAEEVTAFLPQARLALATSDTLTGPQAAAALVRRIEDHDIDLIIGTQIVAKGYHFPLLTLVGVVDADLGLAGGDLRAAERTFQLLAQVGGRAGRGTRAGKVLLQSCQPEHPVIAALVAGDRERFFAAELAAREAARMPPFGRLAAVIVSAREEAAADETSRALARAAPREDAIRVLGPAPAPLALLRGRHRRRLLLHCTAPASVPAIVRRWLSRVRWPSSVRVQIDIDPMSFL